MTSVLIVEDEESLADPLAFLLRKEGFETTVVADGPSALAELTEREREVLKGVASGQTNKEIARQLGLDVSADGRALRTLHELVKQSTKPVIVAEAISAPSAERMSTEGRGARRRPG